MPKPTVASLATQLKELRGEITALRKTQRETIQERARDVEQLDPVPMAVSVPFDRPPSIQELVAQYVSTTLSRHAEDQGFETFEEADDFDPEDEDLLPLSGFEVHEMDPDAPPGVDEGPDPDQAAIDAPEGSEEPSAPAGETEAPPPETAPGV